MHLKILTYLILSFTFVSINGRNQFLDNLGVLDSDTLPIDQNYDQPKQKEKSYLEKLEEKKIYENELRELDDLLANEKEKSRNNQDDQINDYLRYKSINVFPAFSHKELNDQPPINYENTESQIKNDDVQQQLPEFIKNVNRQIDHYLTTMPTDLKNKLMAGPRLRRAWKKSPFLSYKEAVFNYDKQEDEKNNLKDQDDQIDDEKLASNIENNLNKEIDLEQWTKYLMAKRNELEKDKNSESNTSNSNFEKESDKLKESSEKNEMNKKEDLIPSNYSTELKKTVITEQDGKAYKKTETYKKSLELSPTNSKIKDDYNHQFDDQTDLLLVNNQPLSDSNYEKMLHHANLQDPIFIRQRNSLDKLQNSDNRGNSVLLKKSRSGYLNFGDLYFIGVVVACSMASILSVIGAGYCFYRFQQHNKSTADFDYPAYGVIGPAFKSSQDDGNTSPKTKKSPLSQESLVNKATNINHQLILSQNDDNQNGSDRKLAQSAQMYHYQYQKQQMISNEKSKNCRNASASDVESDEENEEGDYTVYECPGLASNLGEIEITNPNFQHEDVTTHTEKAEAK